ncbi:MAG TPA: hypothetical protein ENG03_02185 [Thioploca sp.]|nr:MAG: hypothetical protein B6247_14690 [Beggiatoa sp. 4572_84]RKZ57199.1 MAG: hypothetical protein DRR08_19665 [Gammaproteobacteria bacterium]HDN25906.1 hypothetical protein [Thioploca sp.]
MAFSDFESIEHVITKYPLKIRQERFLPDVAIQLPDCFMEDINFLMDMKSIDENESFFHESFIFPFLREAWKRHRKLKLWSRRTLVYDEELCGEPDYFLSYLPDEVIDRLINKPILAVTQAKKENFTQGWGQCLAEMMACQKINDHPEITVYGIVSSGLMWEFGRLKDNLLTKDAILYSINSPHQVFGILDFLFTECEKQLQKV